VKHIHDTMKSEKLDNWRYRTSRKGK